MCLLFTGQGLGKVSWERWSKGWESVAEMLEKRAEGRGMCLGWGGRDDTGFEPPTLWNGWDSLI